MHTSTLIVLYQDCYILDTVLGPTTCALSTMVNREMGEAHLASVPTLTGLLTENHCNCLGAPIAPHWLCKHISSLHRTS